MTPPQTGCQLLSLETFLVVLLQELAMMLPPRMLVVVATMTPMTNPCVYSSSYSNILHFEMLKLLAATIQCMQHRLTMSN
jgi:hypothetical protein